jgi:hypothetical protein
MLEAGEGEILKPEWAAATLIIPNSNNSNSKKIPNPKYPNPKGRDGVASTGSVRFVVGGVGEEGLAALAMASELAREEGVVCEVVVVNIESYWPFAEFNPQNTIKAAGGRVTLAYESGSARYAQAANALAEMGGKLGRQVDLLPLDAPGGKGLLSALRINYFEPFSRKKSQETQK